MRSELFYKPHLLLERLAFGARRRARLAKLKNTCARDLLPGHIDSLELIELVRDTSVKSIYDIGANVGTWTLLAKALITNAGVEAFEPYPPHIAKFNEMTRGLGQVQVHPVALGAKNGVQRLYITDFSDGSSMLFPVDNHQPNMSLVDEIDVSTRRLDDYRSEHNLPMPDLLKLDVQGFELEVLRGAAECLRHARALITEVSFVRFYDGQCLFDEIVTHLAQYDLMVKAFSEQTSPGVPLQQIDVLFVRC